MGNEGKWFQTITKLMEQRGYSVTHTVEKGGAYTCQQRDRLFIVATRNDISSIPLKITNHFPPPCLRKNTLGDWGLPMQFTHEEAEILKVPTEILKRYSPHQPNSSWPHSEYQRMVSANTQTPLIMCSYSKSHQFKNKQGQYTTTLHGFFCEHQEPQGHPTNQGTSNTLRWLHDRELHILQGLPHNWQIQPDTPDQYTPKRLYGNAIHPLTTFNTIMSILEHLGWKHKSAIETITEYYEKALPPGAPMWRLHNHRCACCCFTLRVRHCSICWCSARCRQLLDLW